MKEKNLNIFIILIIVIVAFVSFSSSFENGFLQWDDNLQITENRDIKELSLNSIKTFFSSFYVGMYQPITTITYAIDYKIAGLDSRFFHFSNILYHLLNIILVYTLIYRIKPNLYLASFITLVFAIHPLQVESVAWLSARSNLIYSFFYLLALIKYIDYIKSDLNIRYYLFSSLFFVLSILSKSTAVTLPILLFVFDYYYKRNVLSKRVILEKTPLILLSISIGILTIFARKEADHLTNLSNYFNLFERFLLACYAVLFYLSKLFAPINLSAFYNYPLKTNDFLPIIYYLAPILLFGLAFIIFRLKQFTKEIIFGIGLFLIPISIVLQIIPVGSQTVTERYMYLPMLGLLFVCAILIEKYIFTKRSIVLFITCIIIIIGILSTLSFQRTKTWKDTMTLFDDTLEKQPRAMTVRNLRGVEYKKIGDYQKALEDFNKVLYYYPNYADSYNNRANVKKNLGDLNGAIQDFDKAIQLEPASPEIYSNKGIVLAELGDINSAIQQFSISLRIDPNYVIAYTNRAKAYAMVTNYRAALNDLDQALKLNPELGLAYFTKGMIKIQLNDPSACKDLQNALKYKYSPAKTALQTYCQ